MSDKIPDIVSSLESHPHIRQVTPHKKVTRTLKLIKCENFTNVVCDIWAALSPKALAKIAYEKRLAVT